MRASKELLTLRTLAGIAVVVIAGWLYAHPGVLIVGACLVAAVYIGYPRSSKKSSKRGGKKHKR